MGLALGLAADLGCPWLPAQLPSGSGVRCGAFGVPQWLWQSLGSSPREEPELWGWDHVRLPRAGVMKRVNLVPLPGLMMIFMGKPLGFSRGCCAREHGRDHGSWGSFLFAQPTVFRAGCVWDKRNS